MLKSSILFVCALVLSVHCESDVTPVPIVSLENVKDPDGGYHYKYETGDGTIAEAEGHLKKIEEAEVETVKGAYEYFSPDGQKIAISYFADETGYHPSGDSIPEAPPLPESTAKLLRYLEEHPPIIGVSKK